MTHGSKYLASSWHSPQCSSCWITVAKQSLDLPNLDHSAQQSVFYLASKSTNYSQSFFLKICYPAQSKVGILAALALQSCLVPLPISAASLLWLVLSIPGRTTQCHCVSPAPSGTTLSDFWAQYFWAWSTQPDSFVPHLTPWWFVHFKTWAALAPFRSLLWSTSVTFPAGLSSSWAAWSFFVFRIAFYCARLQSSSLKSSHFASLRFHFWLSRSVP